MSRVLAFEIGGSHVAAWSSAEIMASERIRRQPVVHTAKADELLAVVRRVGFDALNPGSDPSTDSIRPTGIVVATPGPFEYDSGISRMEHKFSGLFGVDLRTYLSEQFNVDPRRIYFLKDADAFLLGEVASEPSSRVAGLTLGTGIGSAFVIDGTIVVDTAGVPAEGEIYCLPFRDGTVEDYVSTRAIVRAYQRAGGALNSVADIVALAPMDPSAANVMARFGRNLAAVIETYVLPFHPHSVVIGGGIAKSAHLFLPHLSAALSSQPFVVRVSVNSMSAALLGAVNYWRVVRGKTKMGSEAARVLEDEEVLMISTSGNNS